MYSTLNRKVASSALEGCVVHVYVSVKYIFVCQYSCRITMVSQYHIYKHKIHVRDDRGHQIKSLHTKSNHLASHHIISYHIISHHITLYYISSLHFTSHHITSRHVTSHHITSHHITHITPQHITSYLVQLR